MNRFAKKISITFASLILIGGALAQTSIGQKAAIPHTCWGWIKGHAEIDGGTVNEIRGLVVDPSGELVPEALIEVFAYDNVDLDKRTRVAYRMVGSFRFRGLWPGKYELRGSYCRGSGFDAGHTIVQLKPKKKYTTVRTTRVTLNVSQ